MQVNGCILKNMKNIIILIYTLGIYGNVFSKNLSEVYEVNKGINRLQVIFYSQILYSIINQDSYYKYSGE